MQDVFYDANNKSILTPEQQEYVVKVVILAKKLLIFMLKHTFRKKLIMKHSFNSLTSIYGGFHQY